MPHEAPTKDASTVMPERDTAFPLLRQWKAVETCYRVRRVTWQVQKYRTDRAAILGAIHHACQHQDRADRLDAEGQRQQDRNRGERPHAGQHADHVADQNPDEAQHQVLGFKRDAESVPKVRKRRRDQYTLPSTNGIGTFNTYENSATPKTVTTVARTIDPFHVAVWSPSAATNTQAKVPGAMPK